MSNFSPFFKTILINSRKPLIFWVSIIRLVSNEYALSIFNSYVALTESAITTSLLLLNFQSLNLQQKYVTPSINFDCKKSKKMVT